jgi:transketolase
MRVELSVVLGQIAISMPDLMAVSADGQMIFNEFIRQAANRHVDVGIAEGALLGVAAGIARCNRPVVVSSIASFLLRRAYEQAVIDIGFDALPVKLIGIGGGLAYGPLGASHHIPEDVALARLVPGMSIFVPADAPGAAAALREALRMEGPAYIRIGSGEDAVLPRLPGSAYRLPQVLQNGSDIVIFSVGACVHQALAASEKISREGVSARIVEVSCMRPWPGREIGELLLEGCPVITVEEHVHDGGLGALMMEVLFDRPRCGFARLAIDGRPAPAAVREELFAYYGIDCDSIVGAAFRLLNINGLTSRETTL